MIFSVAKNNLFMHSLPNAQTIKCKTCSIQSYVCKPFSASSLHLGLVFIRQIYSKNTNI